MGSPLKTRRPHATRATPTQFNGRRAFCSHFLNCDCECATLLPFRQSVGHHSAPTVFACSTMAAHAFRRPRRRANGTNGAAVCRCFSECPRSPSLEPIPFFTICTRGGGPQHVLFLA